MPNDQIVTLLILGALACVGLLFIIFGLRFFGRLGEFLEAGSVFMEGLTEYFGQPRLPALCCMMGAITLLGCCVLLVALVLTGVSCFSANPASLCRLIGR